MRQRYQPVDRAARPACAYVGEQQIGSGPFPSASHGATCKNTGPIDRFVAATTRSASNSAIELAHELAAMGQLGSQGCQQLQRVAMDMWPA